MMTPKDPDDQSGLLAGAVEAILEKAIGSARTTGEATMLCCCAGISVTTTLASIVGNPFGPGKTGGDKSANHATTEQSNLYAALVIAAAVSISEDKAVWCKCGHGKPHHPLAIGIDYGPQALSLAAEWFQAITGEKPHKYLAPDLAQKLDEWSANSAVPLDKFLQSRKDGKQQPPSALN